MISAVPPFRRSAVMTGFASDWRVRAWPAFRKWRFSSAACAGSPTTGAWRWCSPSLPRRHGHAVRCRGAHRQRGHARLHAEVSGGLCGAGGAASQGDVVTVVRYPEVRSGIVGPSLRGRSSAVIPSSQGGPGLVIPSSRAQPSVVIHWGLPLVVLNGVKDLVTETQKPSTHLWSAPHAAPAGLVAVPAPPRGDVGASQAQGRCRRIDFAGSMECG